MKLKLLPYALVWYTEFGLKDWQSGAANGPIIRLRPSAVDDNGLLQHELVHVRQWWIPLLLGIFLSVVFHCLTSSVWVVAPAVVGGLFHPVLYKLAKKYRQGAEVQAYQEQAQYYTEDKLPLFARYLSQNYNLNLSEVEALGLLRNSVW